MLNGIEQVLRERNEQVIKHGYDINHDVQLNDSGQLAEAASWLLIDESTGCLGKEDIIEDHCPSNWDKSNWEKMVNKSYKERLIIAGALVVAEIDRIQALETPT